LLTLQNQISGDIAFQIIEDVVDMLIQNDRKSALLDEIHRARYDQMVERANRDCIDPSYAVYKDLFPADKDRLQSIWDIRPRLTFVEKRLCKETWEAISLVDG